jgi:hypothetical protein
MRVNLYRRKDPHIYVRDFVRWQTTSRAMGLVRVLRCTAGFNGGAGMLIYNAYMHMIGELAW